MVDNNGWDEHKRLVLNELNRLSVTQDKLSDRLIDLESRVGIGFAKLNSEIDKKLLESKESIISEINKLKSDIANRHSGIFSDITLLKYKASFWSVIGGGLVILASIAYKFIVS